MSDDNASPMTCSACLLPIHRDDTVRHSGRHVSHNSSRCISLLRARLAAAEERAKALEVQKERYLKTSSDYYAKVRDLEARVKDLEHQLEQQRLGDLSRQEHIADLERRLSTAPDAEVACLGCGRSYTSFPLDVLVSDDVWQKISGRTDGGGVMCAGCIVERAAQLPGVTVAYLRLDTDATAPGEIEEAVRAAISDAYDAGEHQRGSQIDVITAAILSKIAALAQRAEIAEASAKRLGAICAQSFPHARIAELEGLLAKES